MSDGLRYAGDYEVLEMKLHTTTGKVFDLEQIYVSVDIYEDIMSSAVTGTITFKDTNNLISIAPIIGQEQLYLKLKTPQQAEYSESIIDFTKNFLYINKILNTQRINDYTKAITLSFTTFDLLMNNRFRVSKVYKGLPSTIVEKILKNDLHSKKKLNLEISPGNDDIKMVFPNVKPFKAIRMITERAKSKIKNSPSYLFYETCFGYNFRSLVNLYNTKEIAKYKQNINNDKNKSESLSTEISTIRNFRILDAKDNLLNLAAGLYSANLITYNWFTKKIRSKTLNEYDNINFSNLKSDMNNYVFNYLDYHNKNTTETLNSSKVYATPQGKPIIIKAKPLVSESEGFKNPENGLSTITAFPDSKVYLESETTEPDEYSNKNFSELDDTNVVRYDHTPNDARYWLMLRRSLLGFLDEGIKIEIEVNGTTNLRVGGVVFLEIPNTTNIKDQSESDDKLTGKYLITKLHHQFSFEEGGQLQKHLCKMLVIRDDYGEELPKESSIIDQRTVEKAVSV